VIARSVGSDLKLIEHQTLPQRRFVIGKLQMSESTASNRLELFPARLRHAGGVSFSSKACPAEMRGEKENKNSLRLRKLTSSGACQFAKSIGRAQSKDRCQDGLNSIRLARP
ncbi:MAG: hypothetical protein ACXVBH_07370, partial [Flavisolibacter sp.]